MNISSVKVELTGEDILSIINEFVKVEGLEINEVVLNDDIKIRGVFRKGLSVEFEAGIRIISVKDNKIFAETTSFKVFKLGVFALLRRMVIKYALNGLREAGVYVENKKVVININSILKDVNYVDLKVYEIITTPNKFKVDVRDIQISIAGTLIKEYEEEAEDPEVEEEVQALEVTNKVEDFYTIGRKNVQERFSDGVKKYSDYIFIIPDLIALIYRLLKDSRVPLRTKLIVSGAIAYTAFPTDIIPDKIPFIGKIDELAVIFFALDRIIEEVPTYVIVENWQGKNDIIMVMLNLIEYITNFTKAKNVEKLYKLVEEIVVT